VTFKAFSQWLAASDPCLLQRFVIKCAPEPSSEGAGNSIPAAYCVVKPHILNLEQFSDKGGVLNLEYFNLGPHEMAAWAPVLIASDIAEMRLSHNRLGMESLRSFLPAIAGRSLGGVGDGIRKLYIAGCDLDSTAAALLAQAISIAHNLELLDVSDNKCGDSGAVAICRSLRDSPTLKTLNLQNNRIGVRGGREIGAMLGSPAMRLKKLNVSWNNIRGAGADAICRAIGSSMFLKQLQASWNAFGESTALELGDALSTNKSLLKLDLAHCGLNDVSAVRRFSRIRSLCSPSMTRAQVLVAYGLRRNSTVMDVNLSSNPIGRNGAQALLRHQVSLVICSIRISLTRVALRCCRFIFVHNTSRTHNYFV
jgi:hypothetical protein